VDDRLIEFVFSESTPQRLDKFLASRLPEFSRARLQALIEAGYVTVADAPARKPGQSLDKPCAIAVRVPPPQPSSLQPENIPLEVVFENDAVMVINKPAGMVVHPAPGHSSGTLVHAALAHAVELEGVGGTLRPGVVHRLDKDTSGLILLAKNDAAQHSLQNQFKQRTLHKLYWALVDGAPPTPTGRIEAAIDRDAKARKQMAVTAAAGRGRPAVTEYRTLERFKAHALIEAHPITGRTHQIRLHLAFIGCPVVGDTTYGRKHATLPLERHFLHAAALTIILPGESQPRTFSAPLPAELVQTLEDLRRMG
jgi:23S rRNA pseudouridine1911/1915/1917 synthase